MIDVKKLYEKYMKKESHLNGGSVTCHFLSFVAVILLIGITVFGVHHIREFLDLTTEAKIAITFFNIDIIVKEFIKTLVQFLKSKEEQFFKIFSVELKDLTFLPYILRLAYDFIRNIIKSIYSKGEFLAKKVASAKVVKETYKQLETKISSVYSYFEFIRSFVVYLYRSTSSNLLFIVGTMYNPIYNFCEYGPGEIVNLSSTKKKEVQDKIKEFI